MILVTTALFELAGFLAGYLFFKEAPLTWLGAMLALAAGVMVYISVEERIPSAQIRRYPKMSAATIILGITCGILTSLI